VRWLVWLCLPVLTGCVDLRQPVVAEDGGSGAIDAAQDTSTPEAGSAPDVAVVGDAPARDTAPAGPDTLPMADTRPPGPDSRTADTAVCVVAACGGYQCQDGRCLTTCSTNADCVSPLVCGQGACGGLRAEFFATAALSDLEGTRVDPKIEFDWGLGGPAGRDDFAVRWTGTVTARHSELYTFWAESDDGMRLWVAGTKIIDRYVNGAHNDLKGTILMQAGVAYPIVVEYFDSGYWGNMKLYWSSLSQTKEIVPTSALRPPP
jgi:hypothetical protein